MRWDSVYIYIAAAAGLIGSFVAWITSIEIYWVVNYGPFYPLNPIKRFWIFACPREFKKEGSWYNYRNLFVRYDFEDGSFWIYKKDFFDYTLGGDYLKLDYAKSLREAKEKIDDLYETCLYKGICIFCGGLLNKNGTCDKKNICLKNNFSMGKSREMIERGFINNRKVG